MDYWAYWLLQPLVAKSNVLILNSVANVGAFDYLGYDFVFGCLDNDNAGVVATNFLRTRVGDFTDLTVFLFKAGVKDWADYWTSKSVLLPS